MIFRKKQLTPEKLTKKEIEEALIKLASDPVKKYLVAYLDEVVRQGIYLKPNEQEGAKFFIERITEQLKKGEKLLKMNK